MLHAAYFKLLHKNWNEFLQFLVIKCMKNLIFQAKKLDFPLKLLLQNI